MKLKNRFIVIVSIIHLIFAGITVFVYQYNKIGFFLCEIAVAISLMIFFAFYKIIFHPFKILNAGVESIADKDFSLKFLPVGQPELDRLIEVFNKMIDHLRLERTITTEKNFFLEKLIEASPAAIIIMSKNQQLQTLNEAAKKLLKIPTNYENITTPYFLPEQWKLELEKLNEKENSVIQLNGVNKYKCFKSYFIDRGVHQTFYIIEELTKELMDAQRQSYEKVIRMMSHEVNNSVGAVNSIIDSTIQYIEKSESEKYSEFTNALTIARERNINLNLFTKRFANIVQIPPPEFTRCNIMEVINHVLICFHVEFENKHIKIITPDLRQEIFVNCDYQQMELVLINIMKNAVEAITVDGEIKISIDTKPKIIITVQNNGDPINPDIQNKLFEPFFTTKKTGQGIGLTLIREVLVNHGFDFSLSTDIENLTSFKIHF